MRNTEKQGQKVCNENEVNERLNRENLVREGFISIDPATEKIRKAVKRLSSLDVTVLIQGETGVGKEVIAKALHHFGRRKKQSFIKINCGIIPEHLIETELFGYESGAFTGANKSGKKGKVELSHGGSLFLDEIGELPMPMQVKLLDFLQYGTFTRVGGVEEIYVNSRIIAASNADLKAMCDQKLFRQDLFYRLNVIPLWIPPLRERSHDIEPLSEHFLEKCNEKYKGRKKFEEGVMELFHKYNWPGNVRELGHVIERAFVMEDADVISEMDMEEILYGEIHWQKSTPIVCVDLMDLRDAKEEVERQLITRAQIMYKSTYKIAEILGINQSTVVRLIQKHKK